MREFLTDRNFITGKFIIVAKLLLVIALLVFFIPLFILPFFNHPCADDYICGYHLSTKGFWEYQSFIYNTWGGRFAATFTGSLFAVDNYLYDHYWMHSLLLLLLNILSVLFMIAALNRYVLKDATLQKNMTWICLLFVALQVCSLTESSTYIFWFSSAITYQLPVVLLQLQVGLWILALHTDKPLGKFIACILLPLLVGVVNGFNELFIVVQALLLLFVFLSGGNKKLPKFFTAIVWVSFVASALTVLLSPGIQSRTSIIEPKGVLVGAAAVGYHIAESLWSICKNPIFWFAVVMLFTYGNYGREKFRQLRLVNVFIEKRWLLPGMVLLFLIGVIGIAVTGLKGGIIPDRYVNAVIVVNIFLLLLLAFTEGVVLHNLQINFLSIRVQLLILVIGIVGLLGNSYIKDAYRSLIAAPLYDAVMDERETRLKEAALNKQHAVVESYNVSMEKHLQQGYSNSTKTLQDFVQQKPSFIFFEDDLATEYSIETLQHFYGVDSIIVK
ncbi:hypothetical protein BH10BAC2_BH10BAC2_14720 [soil metagenome]